MSGLIKPYASGSTSVTLNQAGPAHLIMPLNAKIEEKAIIPKDEVIKLLKLMDNPALFPPSALEIMQGWVEESLEVYFDDLSSDAAKEEASKVLSYLLIDVIEPMFNKQTPAYIQVQILDIRDEFVSVLKTMLPKHLDAEEFIAVRKMNHQKIQMYAKKIFIEKACNQMSEQKLYNAGHEMNQKNTENFESSLGELEKFKTKRDLNISLAKEALGVNDKMFHKEANNLLNNLETAKTTSLQMQAAVNTFEQQRGECLNNAKTVIKL